MRAVNLLPRQTSIRNFPIDRTLGIALALTAVVFMALIGGFVIEKAHAGTERQLLASVQDSLDRARSKQPSTHAPAPTRLQVPVVLSQEQPWHLALDSALASRVAWDTFLTQLEYVVPDKVTLSSVTIGSGGSAAGASSGSITLGGTASTSNDVAAFLAMLARVPKVSQVTLGSSLTNVGTSVVTFQITAQMALPVAAVPPTGTTSTTTTTSGA